MLLCRNRYLWSHRWVPKGDEGPVTLGYLKEAQGPREWSPRRGFPEDFQLFFEIRFKDRITIYINEVLYTENLPILDDGLFGFIPLSSKGFRRMAVMHDGMGVLVP